MSKHTPGPWTIDDTGENLFCIKSSFVTINDSASQKERDYYESIASVSQRNAHPRHDGELSFKTCRANARLMSSAPDLLEALKVCEGNIASLLASEHPKVFGIWLDCVRAAIAKATGEQACEVAEATGQVNINEVRELVELPADYHPNKWGAVFRGDAFEPIGYCQATHAPAHARVVCIYKLKGQA